eukprot:3713243-Rhodomonas_salina.1
MPPFLALQQPLSVPLLLLYQQPYFQPVNTTSLSLSSSNLHHSPSPPPPQSCSTSPPPRLLLRVSSSLRVCGQIRGEGHREGAHPDQDRLHLGGHP